MVNITRAQNICLNRSLLDASSRVALPGSAETVVRTPVPRPARAAPALPVFPEALDGQLVQVFGPVVGFDLAAVEQAMGFDRDDAAFASHAGRPAVIAKALLIAALSTVIPMPREVATEGIMIADIAGNPGGYLGKQVTVRGAIEEVSFRPTRMRR